MFTFNNKSNHLFNIMKATLLLGGNMGNRLAYLNFSCFHISKDVGTITKKSEVYETQAWGENADKPFLNQVVIVETDLEGQELLRALLKIEKKAGRERKNKWGNRTLDIDILFLEGVLINEPNLVVPHPEIANRNFVLKPMMEIAPTFLHPSIGKSIATLAALCKDQLTVEKYNLKRV